MTRWCISGILGDQPDRSLPPMCADMGALVPGGTSDAARLASKETLLEELQQNVADRDIVLHEGESVTYIPGRSGAFVVKTSDAEYIALRVS